MKLKQLFPAWIALSFCLPAFAAGLEAASQESAEAKKTGKLPTPGEVIARHLEAIGGKDAFARIQSQELQGRFELPAQGIRGELTAQGKRPDKLFIKITLPGLGEMLQGFDGQVGWAINQVTGPMLLEGVQLDQIKEQAQFDSMLHEEEEFKSMETAGIVEFEGKQCYKLKLVRKSGREVTEYYDKETGLLRGTTELQESPFGQVTVTSIAEDYKKFGELLFESKITQKLGPLTQVITVTSMEFNKVDDAVFALPDQIKALLKK
jgi:hypothetical protein